MNCDTLRRGSFRTPFEQLLDALRSLAKNTREYGGNFEVLTRQFLLTEPRYKALYNKIELWADWAASKNAQTGKLNWANSKDIGIDLIATRHDGGLCAIQCKFFLESRITKEMLNSFIAASGAAVFAERLFVATGGLSDNLENALKAQEPPILCLNKGSFENSSIDWVKYTPDSDYLAQVPLKKPRPYQETAISHVLGGFKTAGRGRLIMACGTGKTFTSLKIAEKQAGAGKFVLFLVPSLALLSQTLREWTAQSQTPITPFAVCSDASAGRTTRKAKEADEIEYIANELDFPATTDAAVLAKAAAEAKTQNPQSMKVIFCTYHSMDRVAAAQKDHNLPAIDLVICDEAHRTAGQSNKGEDKRFAEILKEDFIRADKRLFMTATPIVYTPSSKKAADERDIILYSMDNTAQYGSLFHSISFAKAIDYGCLCDYKLLLLAVSAEEVSKTLQSFLDKDESGVRLDDATKMVGCYRALAKIGSYLAQEGTAMQSAIAFAQVIDHSADKVSSKDFAENFPKITAAFQAAEAAAGSPPEPFTILADHIDGSMSGNEREDKLNFLKAAGAEGECRVLSNVRCLSEGVDVPALDAVLFLSGKNSQVEITQAVGRVMRTATGKKRGYVILPVVIPVGQTEAEFLADSKIWQTTWQVVQALRSHDPMIDNSIARANAGDFSGKIEIVDMRNLAPAVMKENAGTKRDRKRNPQGRETVGGKDSPASAQESFDFQTTELMRGIYAKLADKCGTRLYWPQWAEKLGKVAETLKLRMTNILNSADADYAPAQAAFSGLKKALQDNINPAIDQADTLNILAAQAIAMPVFSSLFGVGEHDFPTNNIVAESLQAALNAMLRFMREESELLQALYTELRRQLGENPGDAFRQGLIKDIYQNTIKAVYGEQAAKTVVYTPIEAVDFMLRSVADVLERDFNSSFNAENITILDPFTGTGSFITRLMQGTRKDKTGSEMPLVMPAALPDLYKSRLWVNENNLLAYYAAIANIETAYHKQTGQWQSFEHGCFTDTFTLGEKAPKIPQGTLAKNAELINAQEQAEINIIIANPPYSIGQTSANDNAQNIKYTTLDKAIQDTYAADSSMKSLKALYDYYVRAFKWATSRLEQTEVKQKAEGKKQTGGIIAFIINSAYIEKPAMEGVRRHLKRDFSSLYIFNLRGDIRKDMLSKREAKEGGNIFNAQVGVAISILVKNPNATEQSQIFYHDIGYSLSRDEKLNILENNSLATLPFTPITPDKYGDWLNQRDDSFYEFPPIGDKNKESNKILFTVYSGGLNTSRDTWTYNFSRRDLAKNMENMIDFYNDCVGNKALISDDRKISWSRSLENDFKKEKMGVFSGNIVSSLYRPFTRSSLYFDRQFNEMIYQMPALFPFLGTENILIGLSGSGSRNGFSVLAANAIVNLNCLEGGTRNFPLYHYTGLADKELDCTIQAGDVFTAPQGAIDANGADISGKRFLRRSAISDYALKLFNATYNCDNISKQEAESARSATGISKEDIFYYIYGLLHSPDYCAKYKDNLAKSLPYIPCVKTYADFLAFTEEGRKLAALHLNFDEFHGKGVNELSKQSGVELEFGKPQLHFEDYKVTKMRFGGRMGAYDKSTIIYNPYITVKNIPLAAYEYVINGKSAIDWVVDRQRIKTDKDSGIINDPNLYAQELGDPAYPLKLLLNVIALSLETKRIIAALPKLAL